MRKNISIIQLITILLLISTKATTQITVDVKVHSPIGISIKSETPEEIAISIAAEIIMVKNMKKD